MPDREQERTDSFLIAAFGAIAMNMIALFVFAWWMLR